MDELTNMPEEYIEPILPCLGLLKKCSIFIYGKPKTFWHKYCRRFLILGGLISYLTSLTVYMFNMFRRELKFDEMAFVVSFYVVSMQAVFKAAMVILNKKSIKTIILQMSSMWRIKDLTEVQIKSKNAQLKRLKFCYAVFYKLNMIGSLQYILAPLLETVFRKFILQQKCGLLLPFACSFPFDPTGTWTRYIGVYIFETYGAFVIIYCYLGSEFLMITLCSHLSTEFTLLQEDLLNLKPGQYTRLNEIIVNHQKLINLSKLLDDVFNKVIFFNLTTASIEICFFGFSAKAAHGTIGRANNFVAVVCLLLPLFNLCYYGEQLREASAGIGDSLYNNKSWYRWDNQFQRLIWFVIIRSQKPCCLTSLKYNPITLNTFATVLSTTWSYFSLVSNVYEVEGES